MTNTPRRLAVRPLLEARSSTIADHATDDHGRVSAIATTFGVHRRTVHRWLSNLDLDPDYGIPIEAAEQYAEAAGLHPAEVWGPDYAADPPHRR